MLISNFQATYLKYDDFHLNWEKKKVMMLSCEVIDMSFIIVDRKCITHVIYFLFNFIMICLMVVFFPLIFRLQ